MGSPTPVSRYMPQNSKKRVFTADSSSSGYPGVDLPELSPAINRASKPKLPKQDEIYKSMDRLSFLPDEIVFHILSFLPTKNSIRTSLLAKRWRFLWAHLPCFAFTKIITTDYNQVTPLHNLENAFLIGDSTSNHEFESWIETHVFESKVRDLVIDLNYQLTLPRRLFTCESLVYLRILDCGSILEEDIAVSFPSLKKLELINVVYDSYESLPHLLSGCPVLEELTIEGMNVFFCGVYSPSLTRLVIDVDEVEWIHLKTPSLRYFRLCDPACQLIKTRPMTSLIEAYIDIMPVDSSCNVKCPKLSTCPMVEKIFFADSVVKFHNLTDLNLRTDWCFIAGFLKNASNLRVLSILRMGDHTTQRWIEPKQVPECLTSHLESVTLGDFGGSAEHYGFDLVKYILKNGKVLKKMDFIICNQRYELDSNKKLEAMKRLYRSLR